MKTALVIVDVLNTYDHEDAEQLIPSMERAVPAIAGLIDRAREQEAPIVYVNDNFGIWNSSPAQLLEAAMDGRYPHLVEPLAPGEDVNFVLKARHSAFYETPLEYLLRQMGVARVLLCGQVTEQCILYSTLDAYIRHFEVAVPTDGVAHIDPELGSAALKMMKRNMHAVLAAAAECAL